MTRTKVFAAKAATISSNSHRPYLHQCHQKHIPEEVVFFSCHFLLIFLLLLAFGFCLPLLSSISFLASVGFWLSWPFGFCWLFLALLAIE